MTYGAQLLQWSLFMAGGLLMAYQYARRRFGGWPFALAILCLGASGAVFYLNIR